MLGFVEVIDRQAEYEATLARIRRRVAWIDPSTLPLSWRRQLESLDPEALAAKTVRRRALGRDR
jgi:hypothetical protein